MESVKYPRIELNEQQQEVVDWEDDALLVSAGPGSGKTMVVVLRIARMVQAGIKPESILATTFTRKAADEMNKRLESRGINTGKMAIQTTHAYCFRLLRRSKNFKNWNVDDKDLNRIVLKDILGYKRMNWRGVDISRVESFIAACRNNLIKPEASRDFNSREYSDPRYAQAYFYYHDDMSTRRLMTFDDMLYYGVRLLETDHAVLDREQGRYRYVLVDEVQDSNFAQIQLADLVAAPEFNLMVVGDVDQAIYSWRGALPEFMLEFTKKYKAKVIELGVNYRCAPAIVSAARKCIEHNENRLDKELRAERTHETDIRFMQAADSDDEAALVREQIQVFREDEVNLGQIAVLMRTNAQSRALEEELARHKIPYIVLGSVSFYERKEIKDLLSYLRLLVDPSDMQAGERAINRPFRYVSRKVLDRIRSMSKHQPYLDAIEYVIDQAGATTHSVGGKLDDFTELMRGFNLEKDSPAKVIKDIVQVTDYIDYLKNEEGSDTPETSRASNIGELISSATRFETIEKFIEYVDLQIKLRKRNQRRQTDARVQIMTIHKSKGTEYAIVFLIGANEGIIPHHKGEEEEERRLFYVAMTRAKNDLFVSTLGIVSDGASNHQIQPSRFAFEAGIVQEDPNQEETNKKSALVVNVSPVRQFNDMVTGGPRGEAAQDALERELAEVEYNQDTEDYFE